MNAIIRLSKGNDAGINQYLPPKSPSSIHGKFVLTSKISGVSKRRRGRSKPRRRKSSGEETEKQSPLLSGESLLEDESSLVNKSLEDPSPGHLKVVTDDVEDLMTAADFSMVSFPNLSPTSVTDPLLNIDTTNPRGRVHHRRAKTWDSSYRHDDSSKTCFEVPSFFRRQKVMCAEVTTFSNASDTLVSVAKEGYITGKQLHENAKLLLNTGKYEQAVAMFESLYNAQMERFGTDHSSVAAALHNVGIVRMRMGDHEKATEMFKQAIMIRRKVLGKDHLDLAASLGKLGCAEIVIGQYDDARQHLREASGIIHKTMGRTNKSMAQITCHLACLYYEVGELFASQATFEDALDIYRGIFTSESDRDACMTQITETLCNIGSIQNKRKNFEQATESFREALDLQRGIMSHSDQRIIASLDNLAYSLYKTKSYHQALSCYKEMSKAQLSHYGKFTSDCCETLKKMVLIYDKLHDLDGAMRDTKKALEQAQVLPCSKDTMHEIHNIRSEIKRKRDWQKRYA